LFAEISAASISPTGELKRFGLAADGGLTVPTMLAHEGRLAARRSPKRFSSQLVRWTAEFANSLPPHVGFVRASARLRLARDATPHWLAPTMTAVMPTPGQHADPHTS